MSAFVLPLNSPHATREVAGGKGAGLSGLLRGGFPVPCGFVITTGAYHAFVAGAGLQDDIARAAGASSPEAIDTASATLRARFHASTVPLPLADEIAAAYSRLAAQVGRAEVAGALPVAVRSSGTAEDLSEASFAGQHDTFLNVRGDVALLDATRRCWASLWNARALAYRQRLGIAADRVALAVVVQWLLPAARSGVLFTVDPITGDRGVVVINAAWGLGDAVVTGRVIPDTVVVGKGTRRLVRSEVARKQVMTVPVGDSVADVVVEPARQDIPVLEPGEAGELAGLGEAIEQALGGPQDVEWAAAGGGFYVLQSRAVTVAGVPGDDWPVLDERPPQPFDLWTLANVGELWPQPVSPLVASVIPLVIGGAVRSSLRGVDPVYLDRIQWAKRLYGRIYYNEGALKHVLSQKLGLPASLLDRSRGNRSRTPGGRLRPLTLLANLPVILRLATRQKRVGRQTEAFIQQADRWVADFLSRPSMPAGDRELWEEGQRWLDRICAGMNLQNEMTGLALTALGTLETLLVRRLGRHDLTADLVTGVADIQAAAMGADLWRLAQSLRQAGLEPVLAADPAAALARLRTDPGAEPARVQLDEFLANHGHRCPNEAEWLHPRWHEAPIEVLALAAAYLRSGGPDPDECARRQRQRREAAVAWVEPRLDRLRRALFRRVLARARHALRLRDNGKGAVIGVSYPARRLCAMLGERWAERGWLACAEDIFFLTHPEIDRLIAAGVPSAAGLDLRPLAAARRRALAHWRTVRAPDVLGPDGRSVTERAAAAELEGARELRGIAASAGRVRGTARVLLDAHATLALSHSDILVTRATDAAWTAAFPLIGGLVTEIGGQLSHAAIVAREYGIPAVVNVGGATSLIRTGQTIVLDGSTGTVWLDDGAGPVNRDSGKSG